MFNETHFEMLTGLPTATIEIHANMACCHEMILKTGVQAMIATSKASQGNV